MDKDSRPKRYFWRRLAAFVVDFLLAYAGAFVILAAVDAATGGHFYYWGGIATRTVCSEAAPSPLLAEIDTHFPLPSGWRRVVAFCEHAVTGGKPRHFLAVNDWMQDDNLTRTRNLTVPVSEAGDQFDSGLKLDPTTVVAYVVMLGWAWAAGYSPGKRLLGLVVQPVGGADTAASQRFRRELLRLGPFALFAFSEVVFMLAGWIYVDTLPSYLRMAQFAMNNIFMLIAVYMVLALPFASYYAIPIIRWRGQTLYDRLAGTMVVRAKGDGEAVS